MGKKSDRNKDATNEGIKLKFVKEGSKKLRRIVKVKRRYTFPHHLMADRLVVIVHDILRRKGRKAAKAHLERLLLPKREQGTFLFLAEDPEYVALCREAILAVRRGRDSGPSAP